MIGRNACAVSLALVLCHCILRCGGNCACPTADKRPWDATLPGPLHEFALPWANQHPLNEDMVRRARAHVGDSSALRRVLCKAASGQTLHVVVVGGSVTAGTHCVDPITEHESPACGWPARFQKWLNHAFPLPNGAAHVVENLSERASSTLVATELLAPHRKRLAGADLFVVDYAVNDASNVQLKPAFKKTTLHAESQSIARAAAEASIGGSNNTAAAAAAAAGVCSSLSGHYRDRLLVGTERLVRWCISLPSKPAVVYFDTFNPRVGWHKQAQEVHLTVAAYYQLPVISYRDAVWHTWRDLIRDHPESKDSSSRSRGLSSGGSGDRRLLGRRRARRDDRMEDNDSSHSSLTSFEDRYGRSGSSSSVVGATGGEPPQNGLCSSMGLWPNCAEAFWTVKSLHPPWHVHQLLADLIALTFAQEHKLACVSSSQSQASFQQSSFRYTLPSSGAVSAVVDGVGALRVVPPLFGHSGSGRNGGEDSGHCAAPMSVVSTLRTTAAVFTKDREQIQPVGSHAGWNLEEDTPGKPGWISYVHGAELAFDLTFDTGDLVVGFLKSYSNLAQAEVWVTDVHDSDSHALPKEAHNNNNQHGRSSSEEKATAAHPVVLNGIWAELKSELAKKELSGLGHGKRRVHLRTKCDDPDATCKFKLLMLLSC